MLHPTTLILTALTVTSLMNLILSGMAYVFAFGGHGDIWPGLLGVLAWFALTFLSGKALSRHLERTLP